MLSRPYLNHRGKELIAAFEAGRQDPRVLEALRAELVHRKTPSMRNLSFKVTQALDTINKTVGENPHKRSALSHAHQPESLLASVDPRPEEQAGSSVPKAERGEQPEPGDDDEINDREVSFRGSVGSIRPCGAIFGVPSRWTFPDKRDFEIEVEQSASRVEKFVAALRALVKDMRQRGRSMRTVTLDHGEPLALDGREPSYRFPYDGDADLFEGAKVTIAIGGRTCDGRIVSVSSQWLVVSFDEDLGPRIGTCVLRIDNTAMIDALAERLEKVRCGEAKFNLSLADDVLDNRDDQITFPTNVIGSKSDRLLNHQQNVFVHHAIANAVTYLWGPPGTGKTHSLSALNEVLLDSDKRILICSNTNQAVDQLLISLCKTLTTSHPALADGKVLRIGKADGILSEYVEYVTLDGIVRRKSVEAQHRKKILEEDVQRLRVSTDAAQRVLAAFINFDHTERDLRDLAYRREALKKALSEAEITEQEASIVVAKLQRELSDRLAAGVVRRLLMRSDAAIQAELLKAKARKDEAEKKVRSSRLALDDPEQLAREQESLARHQSLTAALRDQDRPVAKRIIEQAEEKISALMREISEINRKLEEIEKSIIAEARVIGATATKTYLTPQQFANFDVVIIDEASMVILPAVYYVSGLAKEKVIVSGDFRQLSPIVPTGQAAIQELIGFDVFQAAGITEAVKAQRSLKRTVMLTDQYRMNELICRMISGRMYSGRLNTQTESRVGTPSPPPPFDGSLTLIDTSPIQPFVNKHGTSRYNLMNALAIRNLVRYFKEAGFSPTSANEGDGYNNLGICTPFTAQRDVLKRLTSESGVTVGTVHRYQGDEKAAMIIDVPDSVGERHVSMFAQAGSPEDLGSKLFNVAVSRAKEHVIFVANLDYLDAKLPADAFLREILHQVSTNGRIVDVRDVLAIWPITEDLKRVGRPFELDTETLRSGLFRQADFEAVCGTDIEQAKKGIVIYSGFVTPQRVASYEPLFRRKLDEGVKIRCVTRPPSRNGSIPAELGRDALNALEAMGCIVDTRWNIHEKVVIIDDEILWFGSLNPLSHTNQTAEMMARVTGKPAALQLSAFMAVTSSVSPEKAAGLSVISENPRCQECGARTTYRLGSYGPFWQCEEECGWKQSVAKKHSPRPVTAGAELVPKTGAPCPVCSGQTVLRHGPHGHFYGCSNYPTCKGIVKVSSPAKGATKTKQNPAATRSR
jgi:hypothetical protein